MTMDPVAAEDLALRELALGVVSCLPGDSYALPSSCNESWQN